MNLAKASKVKNFLDLERWTPAEVHVCVPRPKEKTFKKEMRKRPTPTWRFQDSIFKDYKLVTEELLAECFEFDWDHITKPRLTDQETYEHVKAALKKAYPFL